MPTAITLRSILVIALSLSANVAYAQKSVRLVKIHSAWGGLGASSEAEVVVNSKGPTFVCKGQRVDAGRIQALVAALEAPQIAEPDAVNLGVTPAWVKAQMALQLPGSGTQTYLSSLTNPRVIAAAIPEIFRFKRFDDQPSARVEVVFEGGAKLIVYSHSYYVYMLPWEVRGGAERTYNADISRAVSALLPSQTVNKQRLAGNRLRTDLEEVVRFVLPR